MANLTPSLETRSAFFSVPANAGHTAGVIAEDRDGIGLATLMARRGQTDALIDRARTRLGIELIDASRCISHGALAFIGAGPSTWLVTQAQAANTLTQALAHTFGELASVSDQSDGYAVLRLRGAHVGDALSKLVPIDLHPDVFNVGQAAVTGVAHMTCTLWRLEDDRGEAVFEISVFRSLAESFAAALAESAAEFGFSLIRNERL